MNVKKPKHVQEKRVRAGQGRRGRQGERGSTWRTRESSGKLRLGTDMERFTGTEKRRELFKRTKRKRERETTHMRTHNSRLFVMKQNYRKYK